MFSSSYSHSARFFMLSLSLCCGPLSFAVVVFVAVLGQISAIKSNFSFVTFCIWWLHEIKYQNEQQKKKKHKTLKEPANKKRRVRPGRDLSRRRGQKSTLGLHRIWPGQFAAVVDVVVVGAAGNSERGMVTVIYGFIESK